MRYERKYRIEGLAQALILQGLRLHPAGLRPIFQTRQVNNIYFDTPGLSTYKSNVDGLSERRKYRVRWYGDICSHIEAPNLEIKSRRNEIGEKQSMALPSFQLTNLSPLTQTLHGLCPETSGMLRPVLLNSYKRCYFASPDGQFRLTVDWDLQYTPLLNAAFFKRHHYEEKGVCILELKYAADLDGQADRITQYLPYRRSKNSKYVTGIELCYW